MNQLVKSVEMERMCSNILLKIKIRSNICFQFTAHCVHIVLYTGEDKSYCIVYINCNVFDCLFVCVCVIVLFSVVLTVVTEQQHGWS